MYLAEHKRLKDYRAIKCISKTRSTQPSLLLEADLLKNLRHPGIPIIYDVEEDDEYYYIVEEYVQGLSLLRYYEEEQPLSQEVLIDFAIQLCDILQYLHEQKPQPILYLDLKPEHIIMSGGHLKLIDFGMAIAGSSITETTGITCEFAAPEKYSMKNIDCRTDIYELGAVLYYLIYHHYYSGISKQKTPERKLISRKLERILTKMLQEEPNKRYQSIQAVRQDLLKHHQYGPESKHLKTDIFVMGCTARVGTTHIAISLVSYLNAQRHESAVYQEENSSGLLQQLTYTYANMKDTGGVISYGHFIGVPSYGDSFQVERRWPVCVRDYGAQKIRLEMYSQEEKKQKVLLYVMDGSCWLWPQAAAQIEELAEMFEVIVVLNCEDQRLKSKLRRYLNRQIYSFSRQTNPFYLGKERMKFWELLEKGGFLN